MVTEALLLFLLVTGTEWTVTHNRVSKEKSPLHRARPWRANTKNNLRHRRLFLSFEETLNTSSFLWYRGTLLVSKETSPLHLRGYKSMLSLAVGHRSFFPLSKTCEWASLLSFQETGIPKTGNLCKPDPVQLRNPPCQWSCGRKPEEGTQPKQ